MLIRKYHPEPKEWLSRQGYKCYRYADRTPPAPVPDTRTAWCLSTPVDSPLTAYLRQGPAGYLVKIKTLAGKTRRIRKIYLTEDIMTRDEIRAKMNPQLQLLYAPEPESPETPAPEVSAATTDVQAEIQAAVDRGKALQRAHRMASPPTPWKDRVQAWLDAPVPDDIGETLDRLSEVYNAQKEAP